ncbi:MAG TPA: N-acetyl-gamma-glutamyl-phosphate reductase [Oligoflexia bacterium]|nr:N-acetyl-gamma-glutamyl-phosphate reductase [Oligoflexia bacterium]HMP49467.1 N-acetyl-gamma-glutamyl-phosphate reductase [Oligoflexia bacterium]
MVNNIISVTLIGATGFGAKEFLRLSQFHPEIEVIEIVSKSSSGKRITELHPELSGLTTCKEDKFSSTICTSSFDLKKTNPSSQRNFILLALPHKESARFVEEYSEFLLESKVHIIDLSGNFRLNQSTPREKWYGQMSKEIYANCFSFFTYGLPEINREKIKVARHIANPGCYATASILALYPITKNLNAISIAIDGKSGSSGAGRSPSSVFHHPELNGNSFPYKVMDHRHEPEISENLSLPSDLPLFFTPHVIPLSRGMLVSCYVHLREDISESYLDDLFINTFKNEKFIRLRNEPPQIKHVAGSNFCDIYWRIRGRQVSVIVAIDNLVKGMSGQAIQNINVISGLEESTGLDHSGIGII